jgi:hypothetical protein
MRKHDPQGGKEGARERKFSLYGAASRILTINGGSSSIKFALFEVDRISRPVLGGRIERIGLPGTNPSSLHFTGIRG